MRELLYHIFCRVPSYLMWFWRRYNLPPIQQNPANEVTIGRAMAVLYVGSVLFDLYVLTGAWPILLLLFVMLIVCGALDAVDGHLAKNHGYETEAGRILDPAADSFLVFWGSVWLAALFHFDPLLLTPMIGITILGFVIARKRWLYKGVRTPLIGKFAIGTVYFAGVALMVAIIAEVAIPESWDFRLLIRLIATSVGYSSFWVAFGLMGCSTIWYYRDELQRAVNNIKRGQQTIR